ncbi:hypothetical protein GCM10010377_69200 [Streptomyces viridiviolaceus]|nr:hypothetical protein GCM10010377_69200 [Streptomyces viridiviolaceus]
MDLGGGVRGERLPGPGHDVLGQRRPVRPEGVAQRLVGPRGRGAGPHGGVQRLRVTGAQGREVRAGQGVEGLLGHAPGQPRGGGDLDVVRQSVDQLREAQGELGAGDVAPAVLLEIGLPAVVEPALDLLLPLLTHQFRTGARLGQRVLVRAGRYVLEDVGVGPAVDGIRVLQVGGEGGFHPLVGLALLPVPVLLRLETGAVLPHHPGLLDTPPRRLLGVLTAEDVGLRA